MCDLRGKSAEVVRWGRRLEFSIIIIFSSEMLLGIWKILYFVFCILIGTNDGGMSMNVK